MGGAQAAAALWRCPPFSDLLVVAALPLWGPLNTVREPLLQVERRSHGGGEAGHRDAGLPPVGVYQQPHRPQDHPLLGPCGKLGLRPRGGCVAQTVQSDVREATAGLRPPLLEAAAAAASDVPLVLLLPTWVQGLADTKKPPEFISRNMTAAMCVAAAAWQLPRTCCS